MSMHPPMSGPASTTDNESFGENETPSWAQRYGEKHRFRRLTAFPKGIQVPQRVRIYERGGGLLLQWWDPGRKRNTAERVDGDLVSALVRARQVEAQLLHCRSARPAPRKRVTHAELVTAFQVDLAKRADAGALDPATVRRYAAALGHYLAFCGQPEVARAFPQAAQADREFRLQLTAFLAHRQVTANGRAGAAGRLMKGQGFVLDTVRALFAWAADPERGHLLPEGFRNPFRRSSESRPVLKGDPLAEPDITLDMAVDLLHACDRFQLRLLAPMLLFGLRAAEPCFLFREYLGEGWLQVPCNPDLAYTTKGRRDKRFPLLPELQPLWAELRQGSPRGLLYERRGVAEGREKAPRRGDALADLVAEFRRRCSDRRTTRAAERHQVRDTLLREAGALNYDHVEAEFAALARGLNWPATAT